LTAANFSQLNNPSLLIVHDRNRLQKKIQQ
jgi:hypothetical protein